MSAEPEAVPMRNLLARLSDGPGSQGPILFETLEDFIHNLEPFGFWALKESVSRNPRYEFSLYGGVNTYLSCIFRPAQHFIVKPQALLREVSETLDTDSITSSMSVSVGSHGGPHRSRNQGGSEKNHLIPDFLVVKILGAGARIGNHQPVLVWEVKRDDVSPLSARNKLLDYMIRVATQPNTDLEKFAGVLQVGSQFHLFLCPTPHILNLAPEFTNVASVDILDSGLQGGHDTLTEVLCQAAMEMWTDGS